jgi:hypothetical protein
MKKLLFICLFVLFSCQEITYCWQCRSEVLHKVEYFDICDKTESEIKEFESQYTELQGPVITSMKCSLKSN